MKYIICWKIDVNTTHLELHVLTEDKYYSELKSKRFNITGTTGVKTESSASDKMAYIYCVGSVYIMLNMSNECTCTHNCKGLPNQGNYSSADIWGDWGKHSRFAHDISVWIITIHSSRLFIQCLIFMNICYLL